MTAPALAPSPASPDGPPMTPAEVAAALGGTVQAHDYGPPDPAAPARRVYGRALDPSDMTLKGPCPSCGAPTACGWRERGGVTGRWREVRSDPTPCTACRVSAALARAAAPAPRSAPERPADAAPTQPPAPAPDSASWRVQGRAVAISAGVLTVDGRPVADGVSAESVTVYGRRLYVAGHPVADLAA